MAHQLPAEELIEQLELVKHPEGGWYRETYRSDEVDDLLKEFPNHKEIVHLLTKSTSSLCL